MKYYISRFKKQQAAPKAKGKGTRKPRATKAPVEDTSATSKVEEVAATVPEPTAPPALEPPTAEKPATRRRSTTAPKAEAKPAEKKGRSPAKAKAEKPVAGTRRKRTTG